MDCEANSWLGLFRVVRTGLWLGRPPKGGQAGARGSNAEGRGHGAPSLSPSPGLLATGPQTPTPLAGQKKAPERRTEQKEVPHWQPGTRQFTRSIELNIGNGKQCRHKNTECSSLTNVRSTA